MEDRVLVTGRRKSSVARVFMRPGSGKLLVNGRDLKAYFKREVLVIAALEPLASTETKDRFDVDAVVVGGGLTGQAGALRHGLARALLLHDVQSRPLLKRGGYLTRDPRCVERKKYGQPKARKRFQYSKR